MADYNKVFCSNTDKRTDQVNLVLNAIAHGYRESFFKIQQSTLNISQDFKRFLGDGLVCRITE